MKQRTRNAVLSALMTACCFSHANADYVFPADANILNVKAAPYNAIGDGVTDDTAAIKACIVDALNGPSRYASPPFVYFPTGTYRVTDVIEARVATTGWSLGWRAGCLLVGQSRTGTIIKLDNNAAGFNTPATPKPIFRTGSEKSSGTATADGQGNEGFRHFINNMTIDVGSGNSGAVGVDFLTSNRGAIEDVTIKSSDSGHLGHAGILMRRYAPGPGEIKNVTIDGFSYGVYMTGYDFSMTFEHLTLLNQLTYGILTDNSTLNIRDLQSTNTVPAINKTGGNGNLTVIDSKFSGGVSGNAAIAFKGGLFARNTTSAGYGKIIDDQNSTNDDITGGASSLLLGEYFPGATPKSLFASPAESLNLPIEETPTYNDTNLTNWANVETYGATKYNSTDDDAPGIQAAIDSGKAIVYLPRGDYHVASAIIIRGAVKKIMGFQSSINAKTGLTGPVIKFAGGTQSTVVFEHIRAGLIEHQCDKALSIRHCDLSYQNSSTGTGKVFFEDTIGHISVLFGQRLWSRQMNSEYTPGPIFQNNGGTAWILGYKTESSSDDITHLQTVNGTTEVLGGYLWSQAAPTLNVPLVVNNNGKLSMSFRKGNAPFNVGVRETRGATTLDMSQGTLGFNVNLYVGYTTLLPTPWVGEDIGLPGTLGAHNVQNGIFELDGAGDFTATADNFHFVHQTVIGDCTIIAKVLSVENTSSLAKAAVMIRETTASGAKHAACEMTPGNGAEFQWRTTTGGSAAGTTTTGFSLPYWVKVVRSGNTFKGYRSPDGITWTQQGATQTITMTSNVEVGLAVASKVAGTNCTAEFSNVTITTP